VEDSPHFLPRGLRLTIWGCTYCKWCLEIWVKEQL